MGHWLSGTAMLGKNTGIQCLLIREQTLLAIDTSQRDFKEKISQVQLKINLICGSSDCNHYAGDRKVLAKADEIIQGLRKVQDALGGGYLSAFPTEHFERLRNLQAVWAPFYVVSIRNLCCDTVEVYPQCGKGCCSHSG